MTEPEIVSIRPLHLTIHSGSAMLVADREGWVSEGRTGLFAHDTRYLSTYQVLLEDLQPKFLTAELPAYNCAILTYTNRQFRSDVALVDELTLFLKISRIIDDRLYESIELTSFAQQPIHFRLMINFETSFEDIFEVRGMHVLPPRVIETHYHRSSCAVSSVYRNGLFSRCFEYRVIKSDDRPLYSPNLLIFPVHLGPQQTWRAETVAEMTGQLLGPYHGEKIRAPSGETGPSTPSDRKSLSFSDRLSEVNGAIERWSGILLRIETRNRVVQGAYEQSVRDLASLRLYRVGEEWYPAAGVPWYNCIFGRDALTTALQCLPIGCPFPRAVLTRLAELQGSRVNLRSDEEPGKILHEYRIGELSLTGKIPFDPFYGKVDAALLYVILLHETFCFTGDRELLDQFLPPAERCLRWAEQFGDIDGDGFVEYWMRSPQDYHNQSWKDAGDAVVYPDGRIVADPIAIVEVQGYYYAALRGIAALYRLVGDAAKAEAAEQRAVRLSSDFNARYWLPDEQYYALGLDLAKRPIRSIASNPGQLLWTGIVPTECAAAVAKRLMAHDMFCGWGVRTLSSQNGAYAPLMYQRGSIWPHDNAIIALGLKRYGHWREVNKIAAGIFAASGLFAHAKLPELWGGVDRKDTVWPVPYPHANVPQAWAAGSVPMLLRAILGIEPDVERRKLLVQPTLPEWMDQLTVRGLQFAGGSLDLRFSGTGAETTVEVLAESGSIAVEHVPIAARS